MINVMVRRKMEHRMDNDRIRAACGRLRDGEAYPLCVKMQRNAKESTGMWYVIQTQTGKEQELTECIEHVLAGEGYRACFVIEQECIWRMGGERTIYRKPLFPSYVIADTDTPEAFFLALKRIPKLSKLLRTDCEFWSIREAEKELLCRMMGRTAADVDEDKIKDICREKAKISKKAASAGVNEMRESAQKKHYIVRLSPVTLDADGNIVKAEGPLAFFKDQIVRKRIRKRVVTVEVELLGEMRRIELGICLREDGKYRDKKEGYKKQTNESIRTI